MSRGIITSLEARSVFLNRGIRELPNCDNLSEQPTLADLVLPGTGHSFSAEFSSALSVFCTNGEPE